MKTNRKSRLFSAGLVLALAALACNAPSNEPTPTFTPAPATETPLPLPITGAEEECIATANQDVNMRLGPGTAWGVVGQLAGGNSGKVTGHNGDRTWWQLNDSMWVSAPFVTTSRDCDGILVAPTLLTKQPPDNNDNRIIRTKSKTRTSPKLRQLPTKSVSIQSGFEVLFLVSHGPGDH
jgi:uncharacterized protein YgiM (DUF1202 family)